MFGTKREEASHREATASNIDTTPTTSENVPYTSSSSIDNIPHKENNVNDVINSELPIVSAYKNKATEQQTENVQALSSNVRNDSVDTEVSNNNVSQTKQIVNDKASTRNKTKPTYASLEIRTRKNIPVTAEEVKAVTAFGDRGSELVAELSNTDGATLDRVMTEVKGSYLAGFANPKVNIATVQSEFTPAQADAYTAG